MTLLTWHDGCVRDFFNYIHNAVNNVVSNDRVYSVGTECGKWAGSCVWPEHNPQLPNYIIFHEMINSIFYKLIESKYYYKLPTWV